MVTLKKLAKELGLEVIHDAGKSELAVETADISRPGLQLAGFFDYFESNRIQIMGKAEMAYLDIFDEEMRREKFSRFLECDPPCVMLGHDIDPYPEMAELAQKYNIPLLKTSMMTTRLVQKLVGFLNVELAPCIALHGVLVDVYGVGVMIQGESGIGKSETALELIKRGHRLVADDSVIVRNVGDELVGEAPETIQNLMEVRGIGIIDIMHMYGVGAIIHKKSIKMIAEMESWDDNKEYDRLGLEKEETQILDIDVPTITIPVRPGRNLAIIIEVAARNYRLKEMGINAAAELIERMTKESF